MAANFNPDCFFVRNKTKETKNKKIKIMAVRMKNNNHPKAQSVLSSNNALPLHFNHSTTTYVFELCIS